MKKRSSSSEVRTSIILEHSRLNREKSLLVLDKSMLMYLSFLFVGVLGFLGGYVDSSLLNVMIGFGFAALAVGAIPYFVTMHKEEKRLRAMLNEKGRGIK